LLRPAAMLYSKSFQPFMIQKTVGWFTSELYGILSAPPVLSARIPGTWRGL
jgi:hypothetical protein